MGEKSYTAMVMLILVVIYFVAGFFAGRRYEQCRAVDAGVAHWHYDHDMFFFRYNK